MALPRTIEQTSGLCMPCFNRDKIQAADERAKEERTQAEAEAIILHHSQDEEAFLQHCAVHCMIDCCGFNALDFSNSQVRRTVVAVGIESAKRALATMISQCQRIGDHVGLVQFWGVFEPAQETRQGYEAARDALKTGIEEAEQAGAGQPATRSESKSEGSDKPQPEAEWRSR